MKTEIRFQLRLKAAVWNSGQCTRSSTPRYLLNDEGENCKILPQMNIMKVVWGQHRLILVPAAAVIRVVQVLFLMTRRKGCVDGK
jgi:hypothetical protein